MTRLLTAALIASSMTLQSCTLCSIITYPIFFLLTTEHQPVTTKERHLCKDQEPETTPGERYLSLIYR